MTVRQLTKTMRVNLICVGKKMPAWVTQGYEEYAKRLNKDCQLHLIEIDMAKRGKTSSPQKYKQEEAKKIRAVLPKGSYLVSLDVQGNQPGTEKLSVKLDQWMHLGRDVSILIGGPDGIDDRLLSESDEKMSLSNLTFPHPLVRVILAEQLYRAWSLLNNHPYHRA